MSINNKNYGRGKIVMLALMMVTSTFAAIGTTAAGPSGMEEVVWEAQNGNHVTHADGEHVYEYADPWDAVYDFSFVSKGLELGETYEIYVQLLDMSTGMMVIDNTYGWTVYDYDEDGDADNSSEFLINGADIEYVTNDTCYDGIGVLYHVDAAGTGMEVAFMHQLIGFGNYDCDMHHPYEHVEIDFSQDWDGAISHPHFDSVEHATNNISIKVHDLMEAPHPYCWDNVNEEVTESDEANCDNSDGTYTWVIPTISYDLDVGIHYHEEDFSGVMFEDVQEEVSYHDGWVDEFIFANGVGCYDIHANLWVNASGMYHGEDHHDDDHAGHDDHTGPDDHAGHDDHGDDAGHDDHGDAGHDGHDGNKYELIFGIHYIFSVGDVEVDCGHHEKPDYGVSVYANPDKAFNPDLNMFDSYDENEDVHIQYGAYGLQVDTMYYTVLQVFGPFHHDDHGDHGDHGDHEDHGDHGDHGDHDEITFICGDGSEIPFEYVNDNMSDCLDGADEQWYDSNTPDDVSDDCQLWSDENCEGEPINWFDCDDGDQVWIYLVNNGVADCSNGEDEAGTHHGHHDGEFSDDDSAGTQGSSTNGRHCVPEGEVCPEDGGDDHNHDEDGNHDDEMWYCEDCNCQDKDDADGYGEAPEGYTQCEGHGDGDHDEHMEAMMMHWDNFTTSPNMGEDMHEGHLVIPAGTLEPGMYAISYVVMDAGEMNTDSEEGNMYMSPMEQFCYADMMCQMAGHDDISPWEYTTGHGHYQMHFDQWEDHTIVDEDGNELMVNNGILELSSVEYVDPSYRMFADMNEDGEVDATEAMNFMSMMINEDNHDDHGDEMVCYDSAEDDIESYLETKEECEDAGFMWVPSHSDDDHGDHDGHDDHGDHDGHDDHGDHDGHDHGDHDGHGHGDEMWYCENCNCQDMDDAAGYGEAPDGYTQCHGDHDDDGDLVVTLNGNVLGEPDHQWQWIDGLAGPVDGSDGIPVVVISGMVWDLSLDDWSTTDSHVITLTESEGPLVEACDEDGNGRDVGHGTFAVYDSWSWSPEKPIMLGDGWEDAPEADGDWGWVAPFNCADQAELQSLSVTFTKTIKDYNADNLEPVMEGPQNDWEQDVSENLAPECHLFATLNANDAAMPGVPEDWNNLGEEIIEEFTAPNGDFEIELVEGDYFLSVHCYDPDGDMLFAHLSAMGVSVEFLEESEVHAVKEFSLLAGITIDVEYHWDSTGGQSGSGVMTVVVVSANPVDDADNTVVVDENTTAPINDDGTCPTGMVPNADATECVMPAPDNVGDIIDDVAAEDGAIPGFTSTLSIISMLGAVLVLSRRKQEN